MHSTIELAAVFSLAGGILDWLLSPLAQLSDASNLIFFQRIQAFLVDEINEFRENLLGRTMTWVGGVALMAMTVWILIQGFRIVTGQSRDSMMVFVSQTVRNAFILSAAMTMAVFGTNLDGFLTTGLVQEIHEVVTGDDDDPYSKIDRSLGYMQLALSSIDAIDVGGDEIINEAKTRAQWFTGIGIAGPAIVGGTMLLMYRIAMALFIGFGPIFIACLMFDSTKQLFQKWLLYGIGTMFSLAVLSFTVSLALDVVIAIATSFWVGSFLGSNTEGISSTALQQGGVGMVLTFLILTAPPIAATFFNGTLAQGFYGANAFAGGGGGGRRGAAGSTGTPPGSHPDGRHGSAPSGQSGGYSDSQRSGYSDGQRFNNPNNPAYTNQVTNPNYGKVTTNTDQVKTQSNTGVNSNNNTNS
jgi:type IV secretion system protein VirB6